MEWRLGTRGALPEDPDSRYTWQLTASAIPVPRGALFWLPGVLCTRAQAYMQAKHWRP